MGKRSKERIAIDPILKAVVEIFGRKPRWVDRLGDEAKKGIYYKAKWIVCTKEDPDLLEKACKEAGYPDLKVTTGCVNSPPSWWPYGWVKLTIYPPKEEKSNA